jgi:anti-anti-sigma factor
MLELASGWTMDVERGPDWLFVRPHAPPDGDPGEFELAESVWSLLQSNLAHRLVLEMDDVSMLRSKVLGQIVLLYKRIASQGGVMRLCGLSPANRNVLRAARLNELFSEYANRYEAIRGRRPAKPK